MGFLDKVFPKINARSDMDISAYFKMLQAHGVGSNVYGYDGKTETSNTSWEYYVDRLYKGNAVVFMVAQARATIFSEITFKWRPYGQPATQFNLFGTKDLEILETPWANGTTGDLLMRAIQDVDIAGNFFCAREYSIFTKTYRLRRLRPDWVDIVLTADPRVAVASDVEAYAYYPGGVRSASNAKIYLPEEICHWAPKPDPMAQYRGMSWMTPALNDILVESQATKHRLNFFERGAHLGLAVMVKDDISGEQMQEFKDKFMSKYQGARNAFEPLFLGAGADVKVIEADLKSMDTKSLSGLSETHIAGVAGVPAVVAGLSEALGGSSLNSGNYKVAAQGFIDRTIRNLWRSFCDSMSPLVGPPTSRNGNKVPARLWYDTQDVSVLNEDRKDDATIMNTTTTTIIGLTREGFTPESAVEFVSTGNSSVLVHTGTNSVQQFDSEAETLKSQIDSLIKLVGKKATPESAIAALEAKDLSKLVFEEPEPADAALPTIGNPVPPVAPNANEEGAKL